MWPFKRKEWEELGRPWATEEVAAMLQAQLDPAYSPFLRDRDYRGIPAEDFERILFDCWFPNDYRGFTAEIWDCDNYAVSCMARVSERWAKISKGKEALAFGYIEANVAGMGWHAFIWHLDDKGVVRFYEPQNGRRWAPVLLAVRLVEA